MRGYNMDFHSLTLKNISVGERNVCILKLYLKSGLSQKQNRSLMDRMLNFNTDGFNPSKLRKTDDDDLLIY